MRDADEIIMHSAQSQGKTSGASGAVRMGDVISAGLKDRRVLMVASDETVADRLQQALSNAGVPMQRVSAHAPSRTAVADGIDTLPLGEVALLDSSTFRAIDDGQDPAMGTTYGAIMAIVASSRLGSSTDHVLMIDRERALRDCAHVLNVLNDRLVEAQLVDRSGGIGGLPDMLRRFMRWLPDVVRTGGSRTTHAADTERTVVVGSTGLIDAEAFAASAMGSPAVVELVQAYEGNVPVESGRTDMASEPDESRFLHVDMDIGDDVMDRIFGDDAIRRERQARMTIVCGEERHMMREMPIERFDLPASGFDHRSVNERFNQRRAMRGSKGDRRMNRGGPGRR